MDLNVLKNPCKTNVFGNFFGLKIRVSELIRKLVEIVLEIESRFLGSNRILYSNKTKQS